MPVGTHKISQVKSYAKDNSHLEVRNGSLRSTWKLLQLAIVMAYIINHHYFDAHRVAE